MMYENIKEVRETGARNTNFLLAHDWVLLEIQFSSWSATHGITKGVQNSGSYYVRRGPIYVVGRPDGVETINYPDWNVKV